MMRRCWQLHRPAEPERGMRTAIVLILAFVALAFITRLFCLDIRQSTVFWAANGALVVALLILPLRRAVLVLAACFLANVALNLITAYTPFESIAYCVLNIVLSIAVAALTRRYCGATTDLSRLRRLATFVAIALGCAVVEAGIGKLVLSSGLHDAQDVNDWLQWSLCDGFGLLIGTPALMLCFSTARRDLEGDASAIERWAILAAVVVLTFASFAITRSPSFLLIYPLLVVIAFRAGPAWVLVSILLVATIAAGMTAHHLGPLAYLAPGNLLLGEGMVQPFVISLFAVGVPANAAIGEKRRARRRLLRMKDDIEHAATHDPLTGLANRELFRRRLGAMLRGGRPFATIFVDLDRFKEVNDTMGHAAGDQLLRIFSARVSEAAAGATTVARLGGDEFALLAPCSGRSHEADDGSAALAALCDSILNAARTPILLDGGAAHVSASVGLARSRPVDETASELMRRADLALYAAKAAGRDGVFVFTEEMDVAARTRSELGAELRAELAAAESAQLELCFEAKVDWNGRPAGAATSLRWPHPTRGMIAAAQLSEIAEEAGLTVALGDWVLREALRFAIASGQKRVSVAVSSLQLRHPSFVANTLRALEAASLPGHRLELEVPEGALMHDRDLVNGKLSTLRGAGIRIAVQDFGRGFSALTRLHDFAVDRVKIDQSFVAGIGAGREATAIVQAIVQLGRGMGLETTAEGVETEAQRRFLRNEGVTEFQGALISAPVSCVHGGTAARDDEEAAENAIA